MASRDPPMDPPASGAALRRILHVVPYSENLGILFTTHWGRRVCDDGTTTKGTGIVAMLGTGKPPCVALRADMDALPLTEKTDIDFRSRFDGRMHACGHDAHVVFLLGAARYLKTHEQELRGTVRLVFQPAEEGGAGAKFVVDEGLFELEPHIDAMFALHTYPPAHTGLLLSRSGPLLAGSSQFDIAIHGKGGHGSMPYLADDPVPTGAAIVQAINTLVARKTSATDLSHAGVISITRIETNAEGNTVIPSEVRLRGTIRAFSDEKMEFFKSHIRTISVHMAAMFDQTADVSFGDISYPVTANDPDLYNWCRQVLTTPGVPSGTLLESPHIMGSEDFSYYAQHVPACFIFIGVSQHPETAANLHSDLYYLDEGVLPYGSTTLAYLATQRLKALKQAQ